MSAKSRGEGIVLSLFALGVLCVLSACRFRLYVSKGGDLSSWTPAVHDVR